MDVHVQIESTDQIDRVCYLSAEVYHKLALVDKQTYTLKIGHLHEKVKMKAADLKIHEMLVPTSIVKRLHLRNGVRLHVWRNNDTIYLGPVVGIFVNTKFIARIAQGKIPPTARKDTEANGVSKCLVYYFSTPHIQWKPKRISGYTWDQRIHRWVIQPLPFPDIVYDCGTSFQTAQKPHVKFIRKQFVDDPMIQRINNSDYLGKWQLYRRLNKHPEITPYLPETLCCTSMDDITYLLNKHHFIYVKSYYGSRGREVMSVKKTRERYVIRFYRNGLRRVHVKSIPQLEEHIRRFMGDKRFIIQQGIDLLTYQGRKIDLRVLICKNGSGEWEVIYNQVNVAKPGATITTIEGSVKDYKDVYQSFKRSGSKLDLPTDEMIRQQTVKIASYIEHEFGLHGEIGMDMAVDKNGKLWFIEANSKPEKLPIPGVEKTKGISPQFLSVFEYAKYLAKKAWGISE
ncbi:MAG: YheC/YheD family protein [Brevibacillus sp.]|nr:YheC/YheD family protein [Brevibacillus sp.]